MNDIHAGAALPAKNTTFFTNFFRSSGFAFFISKYLCAENKEMLAASSTQSHVTYVNNSQNVEGLTLVLVKPLDLDIKHGVRINLDA